MIELLRERLKAYGATSALEEENATREMDHEVAHQDLASNFALKIHALLCRGFLKGRDWFDFSWYIARGVIPNLPHLEAALRQFGPWSQTENLDVTPDWLDKTLGRAIGEVEWSRAADDVRRFLRPREAASLDLWSTRFFAARLAKMIRQIRNHSRAESASLVAFILAARAFSDALRGLWQ